jgi:transcriptional regulatory protein RtcR
MAKKRNVVVGLLGPTLDSGAGATRWGRWRPTVAVCQQEDLVVGKLVLLHQARFASLAETIRNDVHRVSPETDVQPTRVDLGDAWDFEQVYGALHDFARGYPFRPDEEEYLVHITTGTHVAQICLFLLTESRHLPARLLQTSPPRAPSTGAGSYAIIDLDLSRYDRIAARFRAEKRDAVSFLKAGIDTKSRAFNQLIERIEQVAIVSREPILLTGPTGAGKSQLARRIYELKLARRQVSGGFVAVNCATLRGDASMSALFGHVKGAFTGAQAERAGFLRGANEGVLFLDEIGELGSDEQAMLLRAIEEKEFFPMGSDKAVTSDFLLLAGTNCELGARVSEGKFREDLLARINLWTFRLPGLAQRPEDIAPNLEFELERFARANGTRATFNREARERFLAFATSSDAAWRGNFRDFGAAVVRMATLAPGGRIGREQVNDEIERLRASWVRGESFDGAIVEEVLGADAAAELDRFDRVQLADVLAVCRASTSLSAAGRALFARSRARKQSANDADRLRKYLARFELTWNDARQAR